MVVYLRVERGRVIEAIVVTDHSHARHGEHRPAEYAVAFQGRHLLFLRVVVSRRRIRIIVARHQPLVQVVIQHRGDKEVARKEGRAPSALVFPKDPAPTERQQLFFLINYRNPSE